MPTRDYEYRGMMAQAWDLLRGDYTAWPDRPFYREVIARHGEPALDVGCGTGRLLLDYLAAGIDVDGVDNSPEMLAICREKATALGLTLTLHEQQMQSLDLPRRYRTIFVPSSSFLLLTEPADAAEAMRRFHNHLLPGGVLVMPFMFLWPGRRTPIDDTWSPWFMSGERARDDGVTVRRHQRVRYQLAEQLEDTGDRYELVADGEVISTEEHQRTPATRWYTPEQSTAIYADAGFTNIHAVREFTFAPATADERVWTVFGAPR